jgi:hypothetical protein
LPFLGPENKLIGYQFQPRIVCKPSNIDAALVKGCRGSVYRQQQQIPNLCVEYPSCSVVKKVKIKLKLKKNVLVHHPNGEKEMIAN